ncbi:MAG: hypothetical protein HY399_07675, partial [Elusimicrobia bacterium]|nr:hypothetical protein [Elusimicrobiota bacterium]
MVKIKAVRLGVLGLILGGSFAYGQNIPSKIETISLSRIREMQTQGALVRTLGGTSFLFSLAFDGHAEPQLVMLPEGKHEMQQSWSLEALRSGVEYIGKERLILKEEKKEIRVYRSSNPKEMLASFAVMELMDRLYDNAFSPKIPIVKY